MTETQTIPWARFSDKHIDYINDALNNRMCVAEGSIRSGKTIDHCIIAAAYLDSCKDRIHLASGSSMPNAKLNIGDCNGFGLEYLFRGRCHWGKYKGNEALYIQAVNGEKIVIFVGGGKRNSYQKILGNSYGLWIATEINEHYDSEDSRESFIKVAFGRQVAAVQPMVLWDLNPCNPSHRIYTEYVDKYQYGFEGGYLYQHFKLNDNLSISEQRKREIESQYDKSSVWYRRDILGERCVAQGLIYQTFANNPKKYLTDNPNYDFIQVGVDFGGNKSAHAFVATGLKRNYSTLTALVSERHEARDVSPDQLYRMFNAFIDGVQSNYGPVSMIYADSAEQTLINGLRTHCNIPVRNSIKAPILDRIRATVALIGSERFFYTKDCESLKEALCNAVYNPKSLMDERLDDGTYSVDDLDAMEYSWERYLRNYARYV